MKALASFIILLALFPTTKSRLIDSDKSITPLKLAKSNIDKLRDDKILVIEVLVKEVNKDGLTRVVDENWPEHVETTYNIWRDQHGKILLVGEYLYSESGDWFIGYEHYIDSKGKVFAFVRNTNFFNSECTDGVAYEKVTEFYTEGFKLISKSYSLTDDKDQKLNKENCINNYDFPHSISKSVEEFLEKTNYKSIR